MQRSDFANAVIFTNQSVKYATFLDSTGKFKCFAPIEQWSKKKGMIDNRDKICRCINTHDVDLHLFTKNDLKEVEK